LKIQVEPPPNLTDVGKAAWTFPLVGLVIGVILAGESLLLRDILPPTITAMVIIVTWVVFTGGLHLDGWTDCWDALGAAAGPERRLEILKDSRLGTFGALGLILLVLAKVFAVADSDMPAMNLVIAPIVGRGVMAIVFYGTRRAGLGMAAAFVSGLDSGVVARSLLIVVIAAVAAGLTGIIGTIAAFGAAVGFRRLAEARLNMVNGDVIGASCELAETVVLLVGTARF
jgi:adenosylcobinamide-GDP ribazoletransferase